VETRSQREYLDRSLDRSVVDWLADRGLMGPSISFAHGVWLKGEEIDRIALSGAAVVANPGCNLRLGNRIAPIPEMCAAGLTVAFGTDDLTTGDDNDLLVEMRLATLLARARDQWLDPAWLVSGVTSAGATAALFDDLVGALEPGKRADLVLLDWERMAEPAVVDDVSPLELLVTRGRGSDVRTVLIDGRVVLANGTHVGVDRSAIAKALGDIVAAQTRDPNRRAVADAMRRVAERRAVV
jgi:cytosine/adenosine deaminase-related metal-dependent hydrolase